MSDVHFKMRKRIKVQRVAATDQKRLSKKRSNQEKNHLRSQKAEDRR